MDENKEMDYIIKHEQIKNMCNEENRTDVYSEDSNICDEDSSCRKIEPYVDKLDMSAVHQSVIIFGLAFIMLTKSIPLLIPVVFVLYGVILLIQTLLCEK
jgi:hypothetical protein